MTLEEQIRQFNQLHSTSSASSHTSAQKKSVSNWYVEMHRAPTIEEQIAQFNKKNALKSDRKKKEKKSKSPYIFDYRTVALERLKQEELYPSEEALEEHFDLSEVSPVNEDVAVEIKKSYDEYGIEIGEGYSEKKEELFNKFPKSKIKEYYDNYRGLGFSKMESANAANLQLKTDRIGYAVTHLGAELGELGETVAGALDEFSEINNRAHEVEERIREQERIEWAIEQEQIKRAQNRDKNYSTAVAALDRCYIDWNYKFNGVRPAHQYGTEISASALFRKLKAKNGSDFIMNYKHNFFTGTDAYNELIDMAESAKGDIRANCAAIEYREIDAEDVYKMWQDAFSYRTGTLNSIAESIKDDIISHVADGDIVDFIPKPNTQARRRSAGLRALPGFYATRAFINCIQITIKPLGGI